MKVQNWIMILFILGYSIIAGGCEGDDDVVAASNTVEFQVGGMMPITGDLSQYAAQLETFIDLGVEDANATLAAQGSDYRIRMVYGDTETSGDGAASLAQYMYDINGINCLIGPLTSGEILSITESSVLDNVLVLSPGSTAPSLAIPDDNVLRFVTGDSMMAIALSQKMWDDGIRGIATVYRTDTWGEALSALVGEAFVELGGEIICSHENEGTRLSEISTVMVGLSTDIAASALPAGQIAVQMTTLEEGLALLITTNDSLATYPVLGQVRWYGSDGLVQNQHMIEDEEINAFAAQIQYTAPIYSLEDTSALSDLNARFAAISDDEPWTYSYIAYDIVTLIGDALGSVADPSDLEELKTQLTESATTMTGVTGSMTLDDNGDRAAGSYAFWQVVEESGVYRWEKVTD